MNFEEMEVWKRSVSLSVEIYKKLEGLNDFGFKNQITRSVLSIPSNIAEGLERATIKEMCNFLNYSKGSCAELRTQIIVGMKIGYISEDLACVWLNDAIQISKMLTGLMKSLQRNL